MKKLIIFSDLDETLLERHTYSFAKAKPALKLLKENDIPLVIVTSKTVAETEHYRKKLANKHPFVCENGGGIFIPKGYFKDLSGHKVEKREGYEVITLGTPYARLRNAVAELSEEGFPIRGFGDMTPEEIMDITGLTHEEAKLSVQRSFDEPFVCEGCDIDALKDAIRAKGLSFAEGRLYHITGDNDKGKAVGILTELYRAKFGEIITAALGDSPTDVSMLQAVERPILVQKDDGTYHPSVDVPGILRASGAGPEGWSRAVTELVETLKD
ncbi:MAG: HAD-IIB family hydrolase [Nitrospirota bacterium]|jgi:mannosyl-3-phosphoglycerate phosphatase family protein